MACMTPATDGTMISIDDKQAKDMRERVIESLMIIILMTLGLRRRW